MNPALPHADLSAERLAAIQAEAHDWACELGAGQPTTDDVAAFRRWRASSAAHAQAWTHASRTWRKMGAVAQTFEARHPELIPAPPRQRINRRVFLGASASAFGTLAVVSLLHPPLGLWPSWSELGADYRTATGEQRDIELAGDIQVSLNTQTSVSVQQRGDAPRIELVAGEAAVSSQRMPCDVLAGDGRIHVTTGDIEVRRLDSGQVRLRCNRGSAQLFHSVRNLVVPALHEVVYDRHTLGAPTPIVPADADWRQGMVVFHDLPLADVVTEINRYRPGRVVLVNDALADRRFSASVQIDALNTVIEQLQTLHNIRVRNVGQFVFLG